MFNKLTAETIKTARTLEAKQDRTDEILGQLVDMTVKELQNGRYFPSEDAIMEDSERYMREMMA
jgi:hypothetical protein